eukprot:3382554-Prymnesium_polylepis.1
MPETHVPLLLDVEHLEIFAALEVVHAWNQRDNLHKKGTEGGVGHMRQRLPGASPGPDACRVIALACPK